jgi:hypothetical protein
MLVVAQVVVFRPCGSDVVAAVDSDVAASLGGSGCGTGDWGGGWGTIGRLARVCRRFRGVWSRFWAGDRVVVMVDDSVGVVDGSDDVADGVVARGDVAGLLGSLGGEGFRRVDWGLSSVCTAVSQVLQSSIDVPASFSRRGGSSSCTVCMAALMEVGGV